MSAGIASTLLAAWERCLLQTDTERALTLLVMLDTELSETTLRSLPLGQRNGRLLALRERLFGARMASLAACPNCAETLELNLNVADLQLPPPAEAPLLLVQDGFRIQLRLPDSRDLLHIQTLADVDAARRTLFARCCVEVLASGEPVIPETVPEVLIASAEALLAAADPQADIRLDLNCPSCRHAWLAAFDIAGYLWREIQTWAQRLFNDVHLLARAYGWSEADILAMSPLRRQCYLERVRQ